MDRLSVLLEKVLDPSLSFPTPTVANIAELPLGTWLPLLTGWKFPIGFCVGYSLLVTLWKSRLSDRPSKTMSVPFKIFVFLHNMFLCVFSAISFMAMFPRFINNFVGREPLEAWCDLKGDLWAGGLGYWTWLFYLSKYYEVVDTLILLMKNKKPSLLQSYHHAGAILCLWGGYVLVSNSLLLFRTVAQSTAIWIFVIMNSFVHAIMYFYYALTTIGIKPPGKPFLTALQIFQFFLGGTCGISYLFMPNCLKLIPGYELYEYGSHSLVILYLFPLTYMFFGFAKNTYGSGATKTKGKTAAVKHTPVKNSAAKNTPVKNTPKKTPKSNKKTA